MFHRLIFNRCRQVLYLVSSTAECYLSRKYGLRVGAPYGGVCLPKDVPELTSLAPEGSVFREFLAGTGKINEWITNTPNLKVLTCTLYYYCTVCTITGDHSI